MSKFSQFVVELVWILVAYIAMYVAVKILKPALQTVWNAGRALVTR